MLHIGNKNINLAVKNAGVLYVGSRKMGPIINESETRDVMFVVASTNASLNKIFYSYDGINWEESTDRYLGAKSYFFDDKFILTMDKSNNYTYSYDGINWEQKTLPVEGPTTGQPWFIGYGNNMYFGCSDNIADDYWVYSEDGINYEAIKIKTGNWRSIAFFNNRFIAIQQPSSGSTSEYVEILDKNTFSVKNFPTRNQWREIACNDNMIIAIGQSLVYCYSYDGINWNTGSLPDGFTNVKKIAYGNGKFIIMIRNKANRYIYSEDGINWTTASKTNFPIMDITYGNGMFVTIGDSSEYCSYYSYDGITWEQTSSNVKGRTITTRKVSATN